VGKTVKHFYTERAEDAENAENTEKREKREKQRKAKGLTQRRREKDEYGDTDCFAVGGPGIARGREES